MRYVHLKIMLNTFSWNSTSTVPKYHPNFNSCGEILRVFYVYVFSRGYFTWVLSQQHFIVPIKLFVEPTKKFSSTTNILLGQQKKL